MRLPRERRIRASADFQRLRSQGSRLDCGPFLLNIGPAEVGAEVEPARFAVVVAKKAIPLAVNRNRAKRLARELFQTDPEALPAGWEVVLIARPSLLRKPLKDLRRIYAVAVAGAVAKASKQAQVLKFTLSPERRLQLALHSSHFIPMNQNDLRAQKKRSMVP